MNDGTQRFAELRLRYERSLPEKRAAFERAWRALLHAPDERSAAVLQSLAHRLAGSAPPYGFEALGSAARSLDTMLDDWIRRAPGDRESADVLAEVLASSANAVRDGFAAAIASSTSAA
ncbi:MAG TPA: Hpt domain-containing protein [Rhodanobacteraceae bacterium]|nr:Hpt domain-containing protein [Rhodanobacteraceae bacterium]